MAAVGAHGGHVSSYGSAHPGHAPVAALFCKPWAAPAGAGSWRGQGPPCDRVGHQPDEPRTSRHQEPSRSCRSQASRCPAIPPASSTSGGAHGVLSHAMTPVCETTFETCASPRQSAPTFSPRHAAVTLACKVGPQCRIRSLTWVCSHGASAGIGPRRILLWSSLMVSVHHVSAMVFLSVARSGLSRKSVIVGQARNCRIGPLAGPWPLPGSAPSWVVQGGAFTGTHDGHGLNISLPELYIIGQGQ
jgi:hypothetical protein